jgi:diguanylate cyclase (GGDEF)-like protein/PAS domain S-box-containing protein
LEVSLAGSATSLQILLAEQDPEVARRLADWMERDGHRVIHARSVQEAIERLRSCLPHLLIIDWELADGSGLSVLRFIRSAPRNALVPVIMTCGAAQWEARAAEAILCGADDCLSKPLDLLQLKLRIQALRRIVSMQSELRSLAEGVTEGIVVVDQHGTILSLNGAAQAMFDHRVDDLVGRNMKLLIRSTPGEIDVTSAVSPPELIGAGRDLSGLKRNGEAFPIKARLLAIEDAPFELFIAFIQDSTNDQEHERLVHLALFDALTGLPNRAHLLASLEADLSLHRDRTSQGTTVLFIDLDHFKSINDSYGHAVGDEVLVAVAGRMKNAVGSNDLVSRLSGDEFVVLLRNVSEEGSALAVAQRLIAAVRAPMSLADGAFSISISIGICLPSEALLSPRGMLEAADAAMYRAKQGGRGRAEIAVRSPRQVSG